MVMSDLVLFREDADVSLEFACVPDAAIPIFARTDPEDEEPSPVWVLNDYNGLNWEPRIFNKKVITSTFDTCPHPSLRPHEYRVWNEFVISRLVRGIRGDGILTLVHRMGWPWHVGLAWSRYPLQPLFKGSRLPPKWWDAEDLWGDLPGGFEELLLRVREDLYQQSLEMNRRSAVRQLQIENGEIEAPRRMTWRDVENFRRRLDEALDGIFEEEGRR
jgi:hypothetical protein